MLPTTEEFLEGWSCDFYHSMVLGVPYSPVKIFVFLVLWDGFEHVEAISQVIFLGLLPCNLSKAIVWHYLQVQLSVWDGFHYSDCQHNLAGCVLEANLG